MTGFTPEQVPVLNGLAREFGVFDHWFCEVPSQTMMNRSFWTAGTSCGATVNLPVSHWLNDNTAETLFDRLEEHGKTWKIYVREPEALSFTALLHWPRLKDKTDLVRPFSEFLTDAANGTLPDFTLIEPNLTTGHADYHPPYARALKEGATYDMDPPSSILSGEAFLEEIYTAYRNMNAPDGANVFNTALLIGWDEPGGTYDHVPPGAVPPPDPAAPPGQFGFTFDRSGYRVPAIIVSPWVARGEVFNDEHRHTSMLATVRKLWNLGEPFTERDKSARPFDYVFSLDEPRDPAVWDVPKAHPAPSDTDWDLVKRELSGLGKAALQSVLALAEKRGIEVPAAVKDPDYQPSPGLSWDVMALISAHFFPRLSLDQEQRAALAQKIESDLGITIPEA